MPKSTATRPDAANQKIYEAGLKKLAAQSEKLEELEKDAAKRLAPLLIESGLADYKISDRELKAGFVQMLADIQATKKRPSSPLLRARQDFAKLQRTAAHKQKLAQTSSKRAEIMSGEYKPKATTPG